MYFRYTTSVEFGKESGRLNDYTEALTRLMCPT